MNCIILTKGHVPQAPRPHIEGPPAPRPHIEGPPPPPKTTMFWKR